MARRSLALLAGTAAALAVAGPASASESVDVIAKGLDNPRGMDVVGHHLYVAEAGRGGEDTCVTRTGPDGEEQRACVGLTGQITRIDLRTGQERRRGQALPSLAAVPNELGEATGPHDVSFAGGTASIVTGLGGDPELRAALGDVGARLGFLWRSNRTNAGWSRLADLVAFEASRDPDGQLPGSEGVDSNPYSVEHDGRLRAVADAGGNTLVGVTPGGARRLLAVFPPRLQALPPEFGGGEIPMQSVPDAVVRGPKGDLYVGELTGFPFPVGGARVYRVPARGGTPEVVAEGFTTISDIAVGRDGSLYVLQLSSNGIASPDVGPGRLTKVAHDGARTELAAGRLFAPTGLAVAGRTVYVANNGVGFGAGEVLRIRG